MMRKRLANSLSRCPVSAPQTQSLTGSFGNEIGASNSVGFKSGDKDIPRFVSTPADPDANILKTSSS